VGGVRAAVARPPVQLVRLYNFDDLRPRGVGLGIYHVDARGFQARDGQVAALEVRVRRVGAQRRGAGVPAEVMHLVARAQLDPAHDLLVGRRVRVYVQDRERVGAAVAVGVQEHYVGKVLRRGLHRRARRRVEGRVRS
jgi:hypothetical protein